MGSEVGEMFASHRVASSRDVDHASEVLSDVFLPVTLPAARPQTFRMQLNALAVGRVICGHMTFVDAVRIQTAEATDYFVDIPTTGRTTMRAGLGAPIYGTRRTAGAFMPGRPVQIWSEERFSQISIMIPRAHLQQELRGLLDRELSRPLEFEREIDLTTTGARSMMQALRLIDEASNQADGALRHPLAARRMEQVLTHSLLFGQPHTYTDALAGPSPAIGTRPVSRAVELLRSDLAHPWTVSELAAAVSVSVRGLQDGFRRSLDTTPMAYLRRLRLERVREELAAGAPETMTVTGTAARWGFVHHGRFAAAYLAEFGERPSDTLRAAMG